MGDVMKIAILTLGLALTLAGQSSAQSYNCQQSGLNTTERTICSYADLGYQDNEMARLWGLLSNNDRKSMRAGQRQWLKERNWCGSDYSCIYNTYQARIDYFLETLDGG